MKVMFLWNKSTQVVVHYVTTSFHYHKEKHRDSDRWPDFELECTTDEHVDNWKNSFKITPQKSSIWLKVCLLRVLLERRRVFSIAEMIIKFFVCVAKLVSSTHLLTDLCKGLEKLTELFIFAGEFQVGEDLRYEADILQSTAVWIQY